MAVDLKDALVQLPVVDGDSVLHIVHQLSLANTPFNVFTRRLGWHICFQNESVGLLEGQFFGAVQLHLGREGLVPAHHLVRLNGPMSRSGGIPCPHPHGITMTQFDTSLDNTMLHGQPHLTSLEPREVLPRASLEVVASDPRTTIVLGSLPLHVKVVAVPILQHWLPRSARDREGVLSDEAVNTNKTIRYTLGISSTNLDLVFLALSKTNHLAFGLRSCNTTTLHPVLTTSLSPFHDVVGERAASVVLGSMPRHHAAFCEDIVNPEWTLGFVGSNLDNEFQA